MDLWLVTFVVSQMAFVALIVAIVLYFLNAKAQRRSELQARILEKFESPQELAEFLDGREGRRLLRFLAPPTRGPRAALATGLKGGVVLIFLGMGLQAVRWTAGVEEMAISAWICGALGLGLVVASLLGYWVSRGGAEADSPDLSE